MRQKNQVMLNLGTGETGEARNTAAQEAETGAAKACLERSSATKIVSEGWAVPDLRGQ